MSDKWINVNDRLPKTKITDDSKCMLNGRLIPPAIESDLVLVALDRGSVRVDYLNGLVGAKPWWSHYGEQVTHWQPLPAAPKAKP